MFEFTIRLGSTKLINGGENSIVIKATAYYITLGWNSITFENDIGLIRLDNPVSVTNYIRPVQLLATTSLLDSHEVVALGWGQTKDGLNNESFLCYKKSKILLFIDTLALENDLKFVNLKSLTNEECQLIYGEQIVLTMVCVSGDQNEGTCFVFINKFISTKSDFLFKGDTGGALLSYENETEILVGVASFVSGRGCESQDPSGFIRIESYVDWINQVIENVG